VTVFRFRAVITLDPAAGPAAGEYASGTRALLIRDARIGDPGTGQFFQAMMTWDEENPLRPGDHAVVTLTIADSDAPACLAAGQHFTLWGACAGRGVISRQVYTAAGPS
jgi:hypothetical protein